MASRVSSRNPIRNVTLPLYLDYAARLHSWETREDPEGIRFRELGVIRPMTRPQENWSTPRLRELRDAFFAITAPPDALAFLNRCGVFFEGKQSILWAEFVQWTAFYRSYAQTGFGIVPSPVGYGSHAYYRATGFPGWLLQDHRGSASGVSAIAQCHSALEVINSLIIVDRLSGVGFGCCKNCDRIFSNEASRRETFCSQRCGHRYTQRLRRANQRKNLNSVGKES